MDNKDLLFSNIGSLYSFDTYVPSLLGIKINNALLLAKMNANEALNNGLDVISWHDRVKAQLPTGANDDPMTMTYVKFKLSDGNTTIFAVDWINESTIIETKGNKIVVTLEDVSVNDAEIIRKALTANGYINFTVSIESV